MKIRRNLIAGIVLSLLICSACSTKHKANFIFNEGTIYGTVYHIIYESPNGEDLKEELVKEMHRFDNSLSTFNSKSTISRINKNDANVTVDPFFRRCFERAMEISEKTNGAFDITVAPLVNAWGFGFKHKEQITQTLIDSLLATVDYRKVHLEGDKIRKENPATMLDASAIAKGLSVDVVAEYLRKAGISNFMVEIGGEVVTNGVNREGHTWRIGINKPREDAFFEAQDLQAVVKLKNKALATSGNYRNFYVEGGKKFAHTIDPKSGYPVQHSLLSATVLANDCMTADAFATAFMVLGLEEAQKIVAALPELEAYFIYANANGENEIAYSNGFGTMLAE